MNKTNETGRFPHGAEKTRRQERWSQKIGQVAKVES